MRAKCRAWAGVFSPTRSIFRANGSLASERTSATIGRPPEKRVLNGEQLEAQLYRFVNAALEPAIRAGLGAPRLSPLGFVVVEMTGRKTGELRRVPLAALRLGDHILIGTVRGERSLWVRNLAANGAARVWLRGRARRVRAFVLAPGASARTPRALAYALHPLWRALAAAAERGFAFALLAPAPERAAPKRAASPRAPASLRATRSRSR
jgi:F420H(2)-dependent quinone reductase